jgi:DnaJ-class molecular chaperone
MAERVRVTCPSCRGMGYIMVPKMDRQSGKRYKERERCNRCGGSGKTPGRR